MWITFSRERWLLFEGIFWEFLQMGQNREDFLFHKCSIERLGIVQKGCCFVQLRVSRHLSATFRKITRYIWCEINEFTS